MVEGQVYCGIHSGRPAAQAIQVIEIAAMHLGTCRLQLVGACVAARRSACLVPRRDQILDQFVPINPVAPISKDVGTWSSTTLHWDALRPRPDGDIAEEWRKDVQPESVQPSRTSCSMKDKGLGIRLPLDPQLLVLDRI